MSETSTKSNLDKLVNACNALGSIITAVVIASLFKSLTNGLECLNIRYELEEIMGRDWVESCIKDAECNKIMYDIAKTTAELEAKQLESEEKRIKERRIRLRCGWGCN